MPCRARASIPSMDPEFIPFGYEIAGCVNGAQAALRMDGSVAPGEVRFETKVTSPDEPLLWDETILALGAIDPVVLMSLNPAGVHCNAPPEILRVESILFDDGEKAVGRFVLSGCWSIDRDRVTIRAQIVEGWLNLEPQERVTHVGMSSPMSLLSPEMGSTVATRTWAVGTSRGNSYSVTSVSRRGLLAHAWQESSRMLLLRVTAAGLSGGAGPRRLCKFTLAVDDLV